MIAMDSNSGKEIAALPTVEGMDGVYFDARRRRIYISGGRDLGAGSVFVYQQKDPDHYLEDCGDSDKGQRWHLALVPRIETLLRCRLVPRQRGGCDSSF